MRAARHRRRIPSLPDADSEIPRLSLHKRRPGAKCACACACACASSPTSNRCSYSSVGLAALQSAIVITVATTAEVFVVAYLVFTNLLAIVNLALAALFLALISTVFPAVIDRRDWATG